MPGRILLLLVVGLLAGSSAMAQSDQAFWVDVAPMQVPLVGEVGTQPASFRALALDLPAVSAHLRAASLETVPGRRTEGLLVSLPLPEGGFALYQVVESSVMAPPLQARFPNIRTYVGFDVDQPAATVRLSISPQGFHAMSSRPEGTLYIDPFSQHDLAHVRVYWRHDLPPRDPALYPADHLAHPEDLGFPIPDDGIDAPAADRVEVGEHLRIYRTAVAARANFTIYHSADPSQPTVEEGLAAVVTVMNRVNQIYERDVALRFVLVANNDEIIYTDPTTEPYTQNTASGLAGQNNTNLNSVIGSANYDVGHLFTQDNLGGVAALGGACGGFRGWAVTGLPHPVNDPFAVDYVSHELGHQFNATHTMNASGACLGQRHAASAYEPGSGSTIMAYAGLCGNQNIQGGTDDYFHNISLTQITNFLNSGSGSNCGEVVSTGNAVPEAVLPEIFQIPILTGFSLSGAAEFDGDVDHLTYTWEGFDIGPAGPPPGRPEWDHTAPFFRSMPPSARATRFFPRPDFWVRGLNIIGEGLPNTTRQMRFRLTVRGNQPGAGAVGDAQLNTWATASSGPFLVTSHDEAITLMGGQQTTVTWDVANTALASLGGQQVDVLLSLDRHHDLVDGTYIMLAEAVMNNGAATVTIPDNLTTARARIFVRANPGFFYSFNTADLSIEPISTEEGALARAAEMSPVYPNPVGVAGGRATINLSVERPQTVRVAVYDALGRLVSVLHEGPMAAEVNHQFAMRARGFAAGVYYVRATGETFALTRPMTVVN